MKQLYGKRYQCNHKSKIKIATSCTSKKIRFIDERNTSLLHSTGKLMNSKQTFEWNNQHIYLKIVLKQKKKRSEDFKEKTKQQDQTTLGRHFK